MSLLTGVPILECMYVAACARWAWKRCVHSGSQDSEHWGLADSYNFAPVPRLCRLVLSVYEEDLRVPKWAPPGGYGINLAWIYKRADYDNTLGRVPPYFIYVDHQAQGIVLAIHGLSLKRESDYALLLARKVGQELFDGGYVHHGLRQAARWLLDEESKTLSALLCEHPSYKLTLAGHSLGAGIAAILAMLMANLNGKGNGVSRDRIRCYAIAPARCMSLSLAVRYADAINSVVLQDDFLPRTTTPLEDIFKCICCLPCLLCVGCISNTFTSEERLLKDPSRLYTPGQLYHIVERKLCRCSRYPPVVRTAIPVEERFERIILSCNATMDHSLVRIERVCQKALELLAEKENAQKVPGMEKMERQAMLEVEYKEQHREALKKATSLNASCAFPSYGTFGKGAWGKGESESFAADKSKQHGGRAKSLDRTTMEEATSSLVQST
ncbi:hypothetical protein GOP47_0024935 [Adiantum capillus-veneris]|uniref:Uncharacterized protein n=1 Tax=Adiantum capillus-veneris TaxID=13818 RepID=A0A9D4U319_ADICA|nr:hypothetical protein GOP47_0024935 [Adiantum capillus-veneris]